MGRTHPTAAGERRFEGLLESADDDGVVVAGRRLAYDDIERARTRFVWPGTPRPSRATSRAQKPGQKPGAKSKPGQAKAKKKVAS